MRMGVGVGEASLSPAAYSLITDYFPPHRRATAQGIYNIALSLGSGGILRRRHRHWTDVGAVRVDSARGRPHPFLAIGVLHCRTAGRPFGAPDVQCRGARAAAPGAEAQKVSLREVLAFAGQIAPRSFATTSASLSWPRFCSPGSTAWVPTFFIRHFHWSAALTGQVYGLVVAIAGTLGAGLGRLAVGTT